MSWMSALMPISLRRCWTISAIFFRSSLPWLVRIVRVNGLPSSVLHEPVAVPVLPARLLEQGLGLRGVVGEALHLVGVGPGARTDGAGGLAAEPEPDPVDQLLLVDRVREGLAHAPVGEARIPQIEAQKGVVARRVAELVIGLAKGGILGLARVLDAGERARVVHPVGLELEKDGGLARDDAVDDAAQVRTALVVIRARDQHHLLPRLPLLEAIGTGADRMAYSGATPAACPTTA